MPDARDWGSLPDFEHVRSVGARFVAYKNGVRIYYLPAADGAAPRGDSATIKDQSTPSRQRAAFSFGNAECEWVAMSTLTWRVSPGSEKVKTAIETLRRRFRSRWGESADGWIMEMQARGAPHFHLFHCRESLFGSLCAAAKTETFADGRTVIRGQLDDWLVAEWLKITGQEADAAAVAFNHGGLIEPMRSADAAGRYIAKESAKREQKVLPLEYADGLGRWWWLNPRWSPQPRRFGTLDLRWWRWETPLAHVWDAQEIAECFDDVREAPKSIGDVKLWLFLNGFGIDPRLEADKPLFHASRTDDSNAGEAKGRRGVTATRGGESEVGEWLC